MRSIILNGFILIMFFIPKLWVDLDLPKQTDALIGFLYFTTFLIVPFVISAYKNPELKQNAKYVRIRGG